jgi:hypothetical protein
MTLATIFMLLPFLSGTATAPYAAQGTETQTSQPSASQPAEPASQSQSAPTKAVKPEPIKPASGSKKAHAASRRRRKKNAPPCQAYSSQTAQSNSPAPSDQASAVPSPAKDCPPPKIIVRHGGSKEPSIQLAGGPSAEQAAQQRNAINQLLGVSDQNLKRAADMQLSATQQDTVSQTRQFMEQSKAAMAAGDFERARTFAWKAQLLSEDLAKPEK